MADVSAVTTGYFPTAKEGFTTTLASTISSGAVTVPLNSVSGFTNGQYVVLVIEPTSATKKQAFTGVVDTSGVQITGVKWTEGTNTSHTAGVTVVDYETATHWALYSKGLLTEHNANGTHSNITATTVTANSFIVNGSTSDGWSVGLPNPDTITYNGNRSYDMVFNSNDLTDTVSNGMRVKLARTVTPPTQCTDLEASSSQYWTKSSPAGISFTTTFTCAAWIKLESYGALGTVIARMNGTTEGWSLKVAADGTVQILGRRIAGNNKNVQSYQLVPLNKWVHIAGCLDMTVADTSAQKIWIDGVEVPRQYTLNGTATAIVQGTSNMTVGAVAAGADPFDGKIAQASVHSACLSDAQIKAMASQTISSSSPSIVSGFTFNGVATDVSANANDLTAVASAGYVTDSPMNATEYGIITSNSFSTNTTLSVSVPEGYSIPTTGGVSSMFYSTQNTPYKFPSNKVSDTRLARSSFEIDQTYATLVTSQYVPGLTVQVTVPQDNTNVVVRLGCSMLCTTIYGFNTFVYLDGVDSGADSTPWRPSVASNRVGYSSDVILSKLSAGVHTIGIFIVASGNTTMGATIDNGFVEVNLA